MRDLFNISMAFSTISWCVCPVLASVWCFHHNLMRVSITVWFSTITWCLFDLCLASVWCLHHFLMYVCPVFSIGMVFAPLFDACVTWVWHQCGFHHPLMCVWPVFSLFSVFFSTLFWCVCDQCWASVWCFSPFLMGVTSAHHQFGLLPLFWCVRDQCLTSVWCFPPLLDACHYLLCLWPVLSFRVVFPPSLMSMTCV